MAFRNQKSAFTVNGTPLNAVASMQFNTTKTVFPDPVFIPTTWEMSTAARSAVEKLLIEALFSTSSNRVDTFAQIINTRIATQQTLTVTHSLNVS